jgi:hypothetical protein
MRWTDLPPDPGPADGRASALHRGEWEELKRRLEGLPDGHPSRPDDAAETTAAEDLADDEGGPPGRPEADDLKDGDPEDGGQAEPQRRTRDRGAADGGHVRPGRLGDLGGHGQREPYRPWFTEGESPEPWFADKPD